SFPGPDLDAEGAVRTAAILLVTVGDGTSFPTAAHLVSYAGLAPITKSLGTRSRANTHPEAETGSSYGPCSGPRRTARPRLPHLLRQRPGPGERTALARLAA